MCERLNNFETALKTLKLKN